MGYMGILLSTVFITPHWVQELNLKIPQFLAQKHVLVPKPSGLPASLSRLTYRSLGSALFRVLVLLLGQRVTSKSQTSAIYVLNLRILLRSCVTKLRYANQVPNTTLGTYLKVHIEHRKRLDMKEAEMPFEL